ncbi:bifunctional 4-hydroxy-2-oxoglutarate aldolase/2-dehydro-3-deoxy-phosphogluconate aldolase [Dokdonella fugitiva]|jgi:2-dehydro-3-deoxyphosphogluconate aldolase/(4S)-4-hydroxy-2-oxoglutarate aldolase|uniref:bifunctional 4-hydroxy-2-oxoglutarate aldolase/2-dehydro-3-deoxy-phosphogluconate aldolase n=1 Tax=Dokdonella fugitiva TaxID=328517 RepID=UPI0015FAC746|nr:bifunctional 4-hydroxy-2-oxoglutarate aldolase/2-dehydro-3-deoxy-phosphogluconate aldolase [Dokdonella fugitiva]MBA8884839.1 2-dehydro-3-deoxyphosphogluconate aldolase/(4S)-4-hydroxy-2-oxoglutarate aldolase [Dokdonella fugitiva]
MTTDDARLGDTQYAAIGLLRATRILPVVTVASAEQGVAVARALLAGGITAIEITLRTPAAIEAIAAVKRDVDGIAVGAGTVLTPGQIDAVRAAGAQFLVTPGTPPVLADALAMCGLPAVPGAATPTELLALHARGFRVCKLFPASAVGGLPLVRALQAPLADVLLCPTGGIGEADAPHYLAERNVACVGGSWMVRADWIAQGRYDLVSEASARSLAAIGRARG